MIEENKSPKKLELQNIGSQSPSPLPSQIEHAANTTEPDERSDRETDHIPPATRQLLAEREVHYTNETDRLLGAFKAMQSTLGDEVALAVKFKANDWLQQRLDEKMGECCALREENKELRAKVKELEQGEGADSDQVSDVTNTLQKRRKKTGEAPILTDKSAKMSHAEAVTKVGKFFGFKFTGEYDEVICRRVRHELRDALLGDSQPRKYLSRLYSECAGEPLNQCTECEQTLSKRRLNEHRKKCTDGGLKSFIASHDSVLTTKSKDGKTFFQCIMCGQGSSSNLAVLEHMKGAHHPGQWKEFGFERLLSHIPDPSMSIPCMDEQARLFKEETVPLDKFVEHAEKCKSARCGDLWFRIRL